MTSISLPRPAAARLAAGAALAATLLASGCGQEAGSQIFQSDFGNATMNNHLVQTCQAAPGTASGKYVAASGACPGRTLDGEYAQVTYDGYIASAAEIPEVVESFD
jgi:hypothetical protein